jgi:hypothetical protein
MYTRTPSMTGFFALRGSSPFGVLEDELVADTVGNAEVEDCILDEDFEVDVDVEGVGLSSWCLSFSRRCFRYNVLSILESDLWCPVAVDSTCSARDRNQRRAGNRPPTRPTSSQSTLRVCNGIAVILQSRYQKLVERSVRRPAGKSDGKRN